MSNFIVYNADDSAYALTGAGIGLFAVIIAILVISVSFFKHSKSDGADSDSSSSAGSSFFSTRQLVFCAASLAIAFALSYVKLFHMPWGGSVTLCSMFFVAFIGYLYGPAIGLTCGLAYGILQFIQGGGGYILSPMQVGFDYILAFMALGLSGFFSRKKNGLLIGYIVAIAVRGLLHSIGGYLYWMDYMPDSFPANLAAIYPLCYNYAYILVEGAITIVIIMLPPVRKALSQVKKLAMNENASQLKAEE